MFTKDTIEYVEKMLQETIRNEHEHATSSTNEMYFNGQKWVCKANLKYQQYLC